VRFPRAVTQARFVPLRGHKSLFASFSSEKEESSYFWKKNKRNFLSWRKALGIGAAQQAAQAAAKA
jgi:hypothetical protein